MYGGDGGSSTTILASVEWKVFCLIESSSNRLPSYSFLSSQCCISSYFLPLFFTLPLLLILLTACLRSSCGLAAQEFISLILIESSYLMQELTSILSYPSILDDFICHSSSDWHLSVTFFFCFPCPAPFYIRNNNNRFTAALQLIMSHFPCNVWVDKQRCECVRVCM